MKRPVILLLHMAYWLLYLLLLCIFYLLLTQGKAGDRAFLYWNIVMLQFALAPGATGFYVFHSVLFRKFLAPRRIFSLVCAAVTVSVLTALLFELVLVGSLGSRGLFPQTALVPMGCIMAFNVLLNGLVGLGMRSFITWYRELRWKEALTRRNHEMEMALVRAQINPHFLFNTINNIDVLIRKDAGLASDYLNRLSGIMRFMLYESNADRVPLERELEYIGRYIDLQKIRTANADYVSWTVQGDPGGRMIAPMIFIPFIENAFKHALPQKEGNGIDIRIRISDEALNFSCSNSFAPYTGIRDGNSGLGNELIARRLALLYPDRHRLTISRSDDRHTVQLQLNLSAL